jgi:hypothetical protein
VRSAARGRPLAARRVANVDDARRVVARWRAFVAQRKACPLLDLLQAMPDFFKKEVLERLDPTDRTMVAQVGWPWLAAVVRAGAYTRPHVSAQLKPFWSVCRLVSSL